MTYRPPQIEIVGDVSELTLVDGSFGDREQP
ncbi:MAG: lasso RiPP family leader peptide-containing protein [Acidimicrobiia bacterium]|nr:lasso RiPP family leader peptide-containing protein [Acidimicrobiia bacterium]